MAKGKKEAAPKAASKETVEIAGVTMPRCVLADSAHAAHLVTPNPDYVWRSFAFDVCMDILENETVMIVGLPSTGKTSVVEQIAAWTGTPLLYTDCEQDTTLSQVIGDWKLVAGEMVWVDGPLTVAMRHGYIYLFNEFDYASAGVIGGLNGVFAPVTNSNPVRRLPLPTGEVVKAHSNFRILATCNSLGAQVQYKRMFPNARPQNAATLGRFKFYEVSFMTVDEETDMNMREFSMDSMDRDVREHVRKIVVVADRCREAFRAGDLTVLVQMRHVMYLIKHIRRHKERHAAAGLNRIKRVEDAIQSVLYPLMQDEDRQTVMGFARSVFGE